MFESDEYRALFRQLAAASEYVGVRALGFAYASGFVLAAQSGYVRTWFAPLAAVGRTAFMAQSAGSVWWLSRFRYGPAEWVWRSLSYARLQPLRH